MGLAWQQGPLATRSVGRFLVADPLPERLLFAEPLRRRMRVRFGGQWVAESEDVVLLHEPDRYPVAFFPLDHVREGVLVPETHTTRHRELGPTAWFSVRSGDKHRSGPRGSTRTCRPTRPRCGTGSPSPGGQWTPSTKKTSASWVTLRICIIASTSGRPHDTS